MIEDIYSKLNEEMSGSPMIIIGELPLDSRECLAVLYAISPEPHKIFDVFEQHIDFWSRYKSSKEAYDKLIEVEGIFRNKHPYNLDNYHIYFSHSLGRIEDMDRSVDKLKMYKLSMRFIYQKR